MAQYALKVPQIIFFTLPSLHSALTSFMDGPHTTPRLEYFHKTSQLDLSWLKDIVLGALIVFGMKSLIEWHRIHQLGSTANLAQFNPI